MQWEATDQFGNLWVGNSAAASIDELRPHLESLVEQLHLRVGDKPIRITVDREYGEINGPDPDGVSHVIRCKWVENLDPAYAQEILDALESACSARGLIGYSIELA